MNCARCDSAVEVHDLRCPICALPVPSDPAFAPLRGAARAGEAVACPAERPERVYAKLLRCNDCGAATAFSPLHAAPACAFCGATMRVEEPIDPVETAERVVPFVVSRALAERSLRQWLGSRGWLAPRTLRDEAMLDSMHPLCWAAWIVDATAAIAWTADSDHGARRSEWAPHAGETSMRFDALCVPASRGLSLDECHDLAPGYDLATAVPVPADGVEAVSNLDGPMQLNIEAFDVQRSAARHLVQRAIDATAKQRIAPFIPGRRHRKVHVACLVESQATRRVALPAWVLVYKFRDKPYRAVVHGQRAALVVGRAPKDWAKIARLAGAIVAIALVIAFLVGCGSTPAAPDAEDFTERCTPAGPFAPLTGRAAVQGTLNVHVDAGGLIEADTSGSLLLAMDLVQSGTGIAVEAKACRVTVPAVPLDGQEMPIQLIVPEAAVASVGVVGGAATLSSPDATCATLDTDPITLVLGARLADPANDPLPAADADGNFPACGSPTTTCATATAAGCACDQEADGEPGATFLARNVPGLELDQVYVTLRTTFSLHGRVFSTDSVKGQIDATLGNGVLHCRLANGTPCTPSETRLVQSLNPIVTQQDNNPSTFRSVRIPDGMTCAEIIANEGTLFPR